MESAPLCIQTVLFHCSVIRTPLGSDKWLTTVLYCIFTAEDPPIKTSCIVWFCYVIKALLTHWQLWQLFQSSSYSHVSINLSTGLFASNNFVLFLWIFFCIAVETLAFSMRSLKSGEKIFTQTTKSKMRQLKWWTTIPKYTALETCHTYIHTYICTIPVDGRW